ncbi:DUF4209 domain-containing protein [Peribacillus frigoritolerans]|uniref:DUF4209 domain-containing protein n=1 Tax=Peribacillus frigoritolerans TaxID=450367 RepID=UPI002E2068C4|nr:DUF4209 domain-containing protein [Peribacillus frigoritolerans]
MNMSLEEIIKDIDESRERLAEYEIAQIIKKNYTGNQNDLNYVAETIAFDLWDGYSEKENGWGTYYGPKIALNNTDGTVTEYPSISTINEEVIKYWLNRLSTTKNPIMRARYSDLVWEFTKPITGNNPNHKSAQEAIDNNIIIVNEKLYESEINVIKRLERSLNLAVSLKDYSRIEKVKKTILVTEDNISIDKKAGLWGFTYDLLYNNKKVELTEKEIIKIIGDLEARIERLSVDKEPEPWAVEAAAIRLASYYQKNNKPMDVLRVLVKVKEEYEKQSEKALPMQTLAWLEKVHELFLQFNLNIEAEKIRKEIREIGPRVKESLIPISQSMEISENQISEFVNQFVSNNIYNDIAKISFHFTPKKKKVTEQVLELSKHYPLSYFMPTSLMDSDGRTIGVVGGIEDDMEGNLIRQITKNLDIECFFLRRVIEKFKEHHDLNSDSLLSILMESPVFEENRRALLHKGLEMYFNEDFISAIHILIPQIEAAFRRLIYLSGGSVLQPSKTKHGGFKVKLFGQILSDPIIEKVFKEDSQLYFKILLNEPRGYNLRNDICHGISNDNTFNVSNADLLIHVLFCLALIKEN